MKKFIVIKLQIEGVHYWSDCDIDEVSFLKNPHRHIFYIELEKEVSHNDRDIEIIELKRKVLKWLNAAYYSPIYNCLYFMNMSCEMIAENLIDEFNLSSCQVLEDNENGAKLINNKYFKL